jgi:hypothetical protein
MQSNYKDSWNFAFNKEDINHLHMNWKFRYNEDCITISFLVPYMRRAYEGLDHTQENNQILIAHFLCRFISCHPTDNDEYILHDPLILNDSPYNLICNQLENLQINLPNKIDNRIFISIQNNLLVKTNNDYADDITRYRLMEYGQQVRNIQHYCFHSKILGLSRLLGKLLTRIWWIYHTSSPIMKALHEYD